METGETVFRYAFPILGAIFSFYYAFRILVGKDSTMVIGKNYKITIDEEGYVKKAGYIFIVFGILLIVYSLLMNYNLKIALVVLIVGIVGIFVAFHILNKQHGAESYDKKKKKK